MVITRETNPSTFIQIHSDHFLNNSDAYYNATENIMQLSPKPNPDLFHTLRHFFRFGKLCCVVPFGGVFSGKTENLKMKWANLGAILTLSVTLCLLVNMALGFLSLMSDGGGNATQWAWASEPLVFYSAGFFIHGYFLLRGKKLLKAFQEWGKAVLSFTRDDIKLAWDANLIAGSILTSAILKYAFLQLILHNAKKQKEGTGKPIVFQYFQHPQNHWTLFIPYHKSVPFFVFLCNNFVVLAWNFVDILIVLLSRAISQKFQFLAEVGRSVLLPSTVVGSKILIKQLHMDLWNKLAMEYEILAKVLSSFKDFLSPLIFASYAINIFYTSLQLHLGLSPSNQSGMTTAGRIYALWSFVHMVARMYLVTLHGARVYDNIKTFLRLLYDCPEELDTKKVEKMRNRLSSSKTGFTGLGCFVITRPFMLKIISVIFTVEIVLLQAPPMTKNQANYLDCNCSSPFESFSEFI